MAIISDLTNNNNTSADCDTFILVDAGNSPHQPLTHYQRMKLQDGLFGLTLVIIVLLIVRHVYMNYFSLKNIEEELSEDDINEKHIILNEKDILSSAKNHYHKESPIDISALMPEDHNVNSIPDKHNKLAGYLKQFELAFSLNPPHRLESASKSFMEYAKVDSFSKLLKRYHINSNIRNLYNSNPNNLTISEVTKMKDINKKCEGFEDYITIDDLFIYDTKFFNTVLMLTREYKSSSIDDEVILISNEVMILKTSIISANIEIITDIIYSKSKNQILFRFSIISITNKIDPLVNNISTIRYKEMIYNLTVNTTFPIMIINNTGIMFMNKCACDWFGIEYSRVEEIYDSTSTNGPISIKDIFGKINKDLVILLEEEFKGNVVDFYRKYLYEDRDIYINTTHFYNNRDELELIVSCYNSSDLVVSDGNDNYDAVNIFDNQFGRVNNNLSFVRLDLETKQIITNNRNFKEFKDEYTKLLLDVVDHLNINRQSYVINCKYYKLILYYCFNDNKTIDIFIMRIESIEIIEDLDIKKMLYEYSDLPIFVIDKKLKVLHCNHNFKVFLKNIIGLDNDNISDLSLLLKSSDLTKFKRSVSDSIKYKSKGLEDTIKFINNNNKEEFSFKCIKNCIKNNTDSVLSISIIDINE